VSSCGAAREQPFFVADRPEGAVHFFGHAKITNLLRYGSQRRTQKGPPRRRVEDRGATPAAGVGAQHGGEERPLPAVHVHHGAARHPVEVRCLFGRTGLCQDAGMETGTGPDGARTVRVRAYRDGGARDLGRAYRARADADIAALLKRAALAALPKAEGWHVVVVSAERSRAGEPVAAALDRLARRLTTGGGGGPDLAAALAATADGARAALAVAAKDATRIARVRAAFAARCR
jgi:hypothetical protein